MYMAALAPWETVNCGLELLQQMNGLGDLRRAIERFRTGTGGTHRVPSSQARRSRQRTRPCHVEARALVSPPTSCRILVYTALSARQKPARSPAKSVPSTRRFSQLVRASPLPFRRPNRHPSNAEQPVSMLPIGRHVDCLRVSPRVRPVFTGREPAVPQYGLPPERMRRQATRHAVIGSYRSG